MCRNFVFCVIVAFAVATAGAAAAPAYAEAPSGCSPSDQELISIYSEASVKALVAGDSARYVKLSRELDLKVSPACRAALDRSDPTRVRCTADEKKVVLSYYQEIIVAALNGDLGQLFRLYEDLEESLSGPCWIALYYPQDARIQKACSAADMNLIATTGAQLMGALEVYLTRGDPSQTLALAQILDAGLSPTCNATLARIQRETQAAQARAPQSPSGGGQYQPPRVLDHGGGTYSVPGLGAVTPNGIIVY